MNTKSRPARCAMLARSPVSRLSMPTTEQLRFRSSSARWEPMKPAAPVMTIRRFIGASAVGVRSRLEVRLPLENSAEQGHPHDLQVERHRPVLDVIEVELDALFQGGVPAPAVDLCPAGNTGLH